MQYIWLNSELLLTVLNGTYSDGIKPLQHHPRDTQPRKTKICRLTRKLAPPRFPKQNADGLFELDFELFQKKGSMANTTLCDSAES